MSLAIYQKMDSTVARTGVDSRTMTIKNNILYNPNTSE